VLYTYDTYETGQLHAELGFNDDARSAIGNLVSVRDRGSHTRFNYDARGRLRRLSRELAVPDRTDAESFTGHWFAARADYDSGNRIIRQTTGTDIPDLLVGGKSEQTYAYSARGNLKEGLHNSFS
jgi:hypothetical protein